MAIRILILRVILTILFITNTINSKNIQRNVKVVNYSCKDKLCPEGKNILHVKATENNKNDTLHYLWSAIGLPTVLVGHNNNPETRLNINWGNGITEDMKVEFTSDVYGISALVITDVTEYEDSNDDQNPFQNVVGDVLKNFTWALSSCKNLSEGAMGNFVASSKDFNQSEILFNLRAFTKDGYDDELPHQKVSSNSSSFSISLKSLSTSYKNSRFSLGLAIVKESNYGAPSYKTVKSIDDEHTPGTFRLREFNIPTKGGHQTFSSWKPVAYNDPKREFSHQTFLHNFPSNEKGTLNRDDNSIGFSIINSMIEDRDVYTARVSVGQHKDGFYVKTKYMSWTGLVGYGTAPESEISKKVLLILSLGLGLPVALSIFGSLGLIFKRLRGKKNSAYEQIN